MPHNELGAVPCPGTAKGTKANYWKKYVMLVAVSSEAVHQSRPTSKPYIQMIDFFLNNVKQKKLKSNCRIQHLKSENMIHVRSIVSSL